MRSLSFVFTMVVPLSLLAVGGCSAANADDPMTFDDGSEVSEEALSLAKGIGFGEVTIATFGCAPTCEFQGTATEGWFDGCSRFRLTAGTCADTAAVCDRQRTSQEGWYTAEGDLIRHDHCRHKTGRNQYEVFAFKGAAGQMVDIRVDGLLQRADGSLAGVDTRLWLVKGNTILAYRDDTQDPAWTVRLNEAANPRSTDLLEYALPSDGEYFLVVDAKMSQGSAEVVVKTPQTGVCAVAHLAPPDQPFYVYVKNSPDEAEAQGWLSQFPYATSTRIEAGPCNAPRVCATVYDPICGTVLHDPEATFGNACEFESAILARAGDAEESKGYYLPGACPERYCAHYVISNSGSPTYYAHNFTSMAEAQAWIPASPDVLESAIEPAACDEPHDCSEPSAPVCGTVFYDEPVTFDNLCEFKKTVRVRAGHFDESKGYWSEGSCEALANPSFCTSDDECTWTFWGQTFTSPEECTCRMCPSSLVNVATAQARDLSRQQVCGEFDDAQCSIPNCVAPRPPVCVDNGCTFF